MSEKQKNLFDTEPEPWELDDQAERTVATLVLPDVPGGPYDYLVPDKLRGQVEPGRRVRVPFSRSNRSQIGYCVAVSSCTKFSGRLKEIKDVVDEQALLSPSMLRLTKWMSQHYLCDWGQVLTAVVPAGVRGKAGTRQATFLSVPTNVAARMTKLKLPKKQMTALVHLAASPRALTPQELAAASGCSTLGPINALRKNNLIQAETRRVQSTPHEETPLPREPHHKLNDDQRVALDAILEPLNAPRHGTVLIHGVTGSGKTEVYIRAIEEVIHFGRQAIVLVPEISLTPQTRHRFRSRFDRVALLHSNLTASERHRHWQRIARGEVQVVIGARSAVFAPTPHLGLIVLDEEHESSFKQDSAPRYHARDVALHRAEAEDVPLVLGTATPSLESWRQAMTGAYRLVEMPRRVFDRPLPDVATIDLKTETLDRRSRGAVGRQMHQAIDRALRDGGQVILLLNRRGFSTHIQCPHCGEVVRCPDCDIALTHHRTGEQAVCHYCDYQVDAPSECPGCGKGGIRYSGRGTQRLEMEVRSRFPGVACLRMDTDTMRRPGSHEEAFARFRSGEARILVGTQMIAKGLDFPDVTLVGVVNADTALHFPDFRAAERTFQLVTQVAGRTGRGEKGGRVLVQTFNPEHPAIQAAVRHDFALFAQRELPTRDEYNYPPFTKMIRIVVRGENAENAERFAGEVAERIRPQLEALDVPARLLGPAPAPITKLRGKHRFHMLLFSEEGDPLRAAVRSTAAEVKPPADVQWIVDVDPLDML